ncbi:tyrosine-type recombinase/integrase [Phascolarctobacterium faecium]|uniref:tyrosine-type recombinase/integrase n=1 Tax=Phascolarctobacterium faecium TaxID=33025 RepID=UPI0030770B68
MARKKKRADGRIVITKTYNGKRKFFYGATTAETERKREAYEQEQSKNIYSSDILYDEWLDAWLEYASVNISPSTLKSYECVVNAHLRSELGQYSLAEITSPLLREFLNKKKDSSLSARSVEYMHTLLKTSLRLTVDDDLLIKKPMDKIKKIKKEPIKKIVALTQEQVNDFLKGVDNQEIYRLFYVALATGLRRSEILGLRWRDIDHENKMITVDEPVIKVGTKVIISKTTKNKTSNRTLYIDDQTINILRQQRKSVLERQLKTFGYIDNDLVFPSDSGNPRSPDWVSRTATLHGKKLVCPQVFLFTPCGTLMQRYYSSQVYISR